MGNNCFIVTARPTDQNKFDMMVKCLKHLREVTNDMIILSLNYLPPGIEKYETELYDCLVYSNTNESYDNEEIELTYDINTHLFNLTTKYSNTEYGRAANNLRYRACKVAQTFGKTEFTCLDYDCYIKDKNFINYLSQKPILFLQGQQAATGNRLIEGYFFKINNDLMYFLDFFSDKDRYWNYMKENGTNGVVLFYESGMYHFLEQHNLTNYFVSKFDLNSFNIELDANFSEFRTFEYEGDIWMCVEYMSCSHSMVVQVEYKEEIFEFGDLKGRWYIQKLEPYYEGMNYTAVVNGIKNKVYITPESYKKTTIKFF
jgi:hypothetical protein